MGVDPHRLAILNPRGAAIFDSGPQRRTLRFLHAMSASAAAIGMPYEATPTFNL
jgi:hypothetical protein